MSKRNKDGYTNVALGNPWKHDTYLVKTEEGTYEFALWDINGWSVLGDNKGTTVKLWIEIPTTSD